MAVAATERASFDIAVLPVNLHGQGQLALVELSHSVHWRL